MKNHLPLSNDIWQVTNIRFCSNAGDVVQPQIKKINPKDSFVHELYSDLNDFMANQAYVRARLFNRYDIKFDFAEVRGPEARKKIELANENAIDWPFTMDDADCEIETFDEYYTIKWPATWFCFIPESILSTIDYFIPAENLKQAIEQLIWEFLMNTLPLDVS